MDSDDTYRIEIEAYLYRGISKITSENPKLILEAITQGLEIFSETDIMVWGGGKGNGHGNLASRSLQLDDDPYFPRDFSYGNGKGNGIGTGTLSGYSFVIR